MSAGSWTVLICRGAPGAEDISDLLVARGAGIRWCGPECCGSREESMSVFDDGSDLVRVPAEETRGGEHPDWEHARPGEPLPELPELPEVHS